MSYEKQQIKIGLTGGIGSGKTFISSILSKLCVPVFNADIEAKKCMTEDKVLKQKIKNIFGDEIYENGIIQKEILAEIVFKDQQNLVNLNKLVHPVVKHSFDDWCDDQTSKIIVKESAILFETESHFYFDKVICVSANKEIRIKRVINRDNISRDQVLARIEMQISQNEKEELSDFVILNNGVELLLPQIIKIITQIG